MTWWVCVCGWALVIVIGMLTGHTLRLARACAEWQRAYAHVRQELDRTIRALAEARRK